MSGRLWALGVCYINKWLINISLQQLIPIFNEHSLGTEMD